MLNNTAIDVVLGLISIYILYSLIVTTLVEMISTFFNLRALNLRKGIKRMLCDDETDIFFDQFFSRPEIKFLSRKSIMKWNRFPSYIPPASFSKSLLKVLISTDRIKVADGLLDPKSPVEQKDNESETLQYIKEMLTDSGLKIDSFRENLEIWYNNMMDRVAGWYKKRIQLITLLISLVISFGLNVDTIEISRVISTDEVIRKELSEAATDLNSGNENPEISDLVKQIDQHGSILVLKRGYLENADPGDIILNIVGCILSGLAFSLGAPFWFDLLSKFIKIKGVGTVSELSDSEPKKKVKKNKKVGES